MLPTNNCPHCNKSKVFYVRKIFPLEFKQEQLKNVKMSGHMALMA